MKTAYLLSALIAFPVFADSVFVDDVVVQGSLGVGFDAVNGEEFGFDTIRIKENNTRIRFDDTSNSGSFPNNDWQLTANDSTNGGDNKFSIDDITHGRTPFTVMANAPEDALYVDSTGHLGLGTENPAQDIHVVSGDSPALRFDQLGSSELPAQVWDLIANEWAFSIRDVTQSGDVPFMIAPATPAYSLVLGANGVGVGTKTPTAKLDVQDATDSTVAMIANTSVSNSPRTVLHLRNTGPASLEISNTTTSGTASVWMLTVNDAGNLVIGTNGVELLVLDGLGNLTVSGTVSQGSDRQRKEDIAEVNAVEMLEKLASVPVKTWRFKGDSVQHIGPMAQDFYRTFDVGETDRRIATVDADGVALAAIQALHKDAIDKAERIAKLQEENRQLEARLKKLETFVQGL